MEMKDLTSKGASLIILGTTWFKHVLMVKIAQLEDEKHLRDKNLQAVSFFS